MSEKGITFKLLQSMFLAFCDNELDKRQLDTMTTVGNYLNAVDKERKNNGGKDYKIKQLDKILQVDLPPVPKSEQTLVSVFKDKPVTTGTAVIDKQDTEIDFDPENVIAEIDLIMGTELTMLNNNVVNFRILDNEAIAGSVTFNDVSMSKKLAWFEKRFLTNASANENR